MLLTLEALKDPKVVFCAIDYFHTEVGEDFIDQNETIVESAPFIIWLQDKGYITPEVADQMLEEVDCIQQLLHGYGEGLFPKHGECDNVATYKAYSLLAEYISSFAEFRKRFYTIMEEEELLDMPDEQLEHKLTLTDEIVEKKSGYFFDNCSPADGYDYFVSKQISECDLD